MLLEFVFTTSSHPFASWFFKFKGYDAEFGTYQSIILCLAGLYKSVKLEVEAGMCLIYRCYRSIIGLNWVAFTESGNRDVQANLFAAEIVSNIKETKNLLYFVCDNGR